MTLQNATWFLFTKRNHFTEFYEYFLKPSFAEKFHEEIFFCDIMSGAALKRHGHEVKQRVLFIASILFVVATASLWKPISTARAKAPFTIFIRNSTFSSQTQQPLLPRQIGLTSGFISSLNGLIHIYPKAHPNMYLVGSAVRLLSSRQGRPRFQLGTQPSVRAS